MNNTMLRAISMLLLAEGRGEGDQEKREVRQGN